MPRQIYQVFVTFAQLEKTNGPHYENLDILNAEWIATTASRNFLPWGEPSPLLAYLPAEQQNLANFFQRWPVPYLVCWAGQRIFALALWYFCFKQWWNNGTKNHPWHFWMMRCDVYNLVIRLKLCILDDSVGTFWTMMGLTLTLRESGVKGWILPMLQNSSRPWCLNTCRSTVVDPMDKCCNWYMMGAHQLANSYGLFLDQVFSYPSQMLTKLFVLVTPSCWLTWSLPKHLWHQTVRCSSWSQRLMRWRTLFLKCWFNTNGTPNPFVTQFPSPQLCVRILLGM